MGMKKILLSVSLLLTICFVKANQQLNYSATLFYNNTNGTIEVTLWVQNSTQPSGSGCGTNKLYLAGIDFTLEYNPSILSLQSWTMLPSGQQLDYPGDYFNGSQPVPDNTIYSTRDLSSTYSGRNDSTIEFIRTTNLCANTIFLDCQTSYPVFKAVFYINPALIPNPYDATHPNDATNYPNYIAEFSGYYTTGPDNGQIMPPSNSNKQLLFNIPPNNALKSAGSTCTTTTVGNNIPSINDDPSIPDVFYSTNAPLPVTLISFEAFKQNNKSILQWQTATEINNQGFEIQRKTSGKFEKIGFIPSKSENGNSFANLSYEFTDAGLPANATIYYRVKQVGLDKSESYSEIKAIRNNVKSLQVLVYPNPNNGTTNIVLPGDSKNINISLMDYSGKLIRTWNNLSSQALVIKDMKKGFYLLQVSNPQTGELASQKITVL